MIFNISSGGLAYISVTAPAGASISASCNGVTVTGTGTCTLEVPVIGTWAVSCTLDGDTKTQDVNVTAFGQTYSVSFSYSASIVVTTFPLSSVTATKTGQTSLTGTADSNGNCTLTVPAGGLGQWSVTANNGSVSESGNVDVAAYDNSYPISLLTLVPDFTVTINGNTYRYKGAAINNTNLTVTPVGLTGWKLWARTSGSIRFDRLPTAVDICVVGKGTGGGRYWYGDATDHGGSGGTGGEISNKYSQRLTVGQTYNFTVGANGTSIGNIASAGIGGGASGGSGGEFYWTWSQPGHGAAGKYAFNDRSFDGVEYGHGGDGGDVNAGDGSRGSTTGVYANPGAGGAGGGQSNNNPTGGNIGILIMRSAA